MTRGKERWKVSFYLLIKCLIFELICKVVFFLLLLLIVTRQRNKDLRYTREHIKSLSMNTII